MDKKTSTGKTLVKIGCAIGGVALTSGIGLPWLGAMAGSCLPDLAKDIVNFLTASADDDEKKKALEKLFIEPLDSLVPEIAGGIIDKFYQSHQDAKESELNYDLPRAIIKVWEEALIRMIPTKREKSLNTLNRDYVREELVIFWQQKLHNAQSDNDTLKELFGNTPDYYLEIEQGEKNFIDVLPSEKLVEELFWERIEKSFTNWANSKDKFPLNWQRSIHQDLKSELRKKLFHKFASVLKAKLKENERAWKSFEFASSLQTVSILQSITSNIDQIKDDTNNIKQDLVDLIQTLPFVMKIILRRFDDLDASTKKFLHSNENTNNLLTDFRSEVSNKLSELNKDITTTKDYAKQAAENSKISINRLDDAVLILSSIEKVINSKTSNYEIAEVKTFETLEIEIKTLSDHIIGTLQTAIENIPETNGILIEAKLRELLGLLYYHKHKFEDSIHHHKIASKKFETVGNKIKQHTNLFGIGNSLLNDKRRDEAILNYRTSIQSLLETLE